MKTIILRHDFDWDSGLYEGVKLMFDIEKKYNVKSTIFLRYDRGVADHKHKQFYKDMESEGWEFGLHLANHENKAGYDKPEKELAVVRNLDLNILGVAACGGTYNWLDSNGWIVQDSLGLKYICPSALKIPEGYTMKTQLAPTHLTLDGGYICKDGDKSYDRLINDFTAMIEQRGVLALLSHNLWFYREYIPKNCPNERLTNTPYYEKFIKHFQELGGYQFKTFKEYLGL